MQSHLCGAGLRTASREPTKEDPCPLWEDCFQLAWAEEAKGGSKAVLGWLSRYVLTWGAWAGFVEKCPPRLLT